VKMRLVDPAKTQQAVAVLRDLGKEQIYSVAETGDISLPGDGGSSILADVVRRLDAAGIQLAELGLTPTNPGRCLSGPITGHAAENTVEAAPVKK